MSSGRDSDPHTVDVGRKSLRRHTEEILTDVVEEVSGTERRLPVTPIHWSSSVCLYGPLGWRDESCE